MRVSLYSRCSTCRKAAQWLHDHGIVFEEVSIIEQPPSLADLRRMLKNYDGNIRRLFNTSGIQYRERNLAQLLPELDDEEALALLASDGRLIKRPFLLEDDGRGLVGFREPEWMAFFS